MEERAAALGRMNARFKTDGLPDRNTEYFLYQTHDWRMADLQRSGSTAYMEKAAREAKEQTSWTQQNKEFEDALQALHRPALRSREFVADLEDVGGARESCRGT